MKIPEDIRRTVADVTEKVVEKGQQLGREAQLQVQLKKLQVDHARKIHDLGKRTYEWYRSGNMVVSGPVPREVGDICSGLDDTSRHIASTQSLIAATRHAAVPMRLSGEPRPDIARDLPASGFSAVNPTALPDLPQTNLKAPNEE